jgi:hypothetical protein
LDDLSGGSLVGIGSSIFHPEAPAVAFILWGKEVYATYLSVGWQYRKCHRTIVSGYNCGTLWTIEYHMVCTSSFGEYSF